LKNFKFYFGGILIIIGLILTGISTLVLFGTFIYDLVKTDMSLINIFLDAIGNWISIGITSLILIILGAIIRS